MSIESAFDDNPWVSAAPLPSPEERRRGLLAPVAAPAPRHRPKLLYAGVAVATIIAIVCVQLGLSIAASNGAYRLGALQAEKAKVDRAYQAATETVTTLSSPQNLARNANALGMVSNATPVYLRLSDGKVIGNPTPAGREGTVTGRSGNLVANALLGTLGVGADAGKKPAAKPGKSDAKTATPKANAKPKPTGPVPWKGLLPAPDTH